MITLIERRQGMTITITRKEYDAISSVLDQVKTDYEAASDQDYLKTMGESIEQVYKVLRKYQAALRKANEFKSIRAYVAERNRGLRARDIDKLTRQVIKKIKDCY